MEKHLSTLGYWLGLICTVLALILRVIGRFHVIDFPVGGGNRIDFGSFLRGAELFFLLSIASWRRNAKA